MDVKSAFMNGTLEEEVYKEQSKGFVDPKKRNSNVNGTRVNIV